MVVYNNFKCARLAVVRTSLLLVTGLICCVAQQTPDQTLQAEKFNYSVSFRQNVCDLQKAIDNNTVELQYALSGLDLRAVALNSEYFLYDVDSDTLNEEYGGIIVEVMDELASRAGFRWRDSFNVVNDDIGNRTFTDLLKWTTETYDISLDWWTFSLQRMSLGITFPEGWYDSSIIMVGKSAKEESAFSLWSWTEPFSKAVWGLIVATVVFSGIIYWFLELIDKHSDAQDLERNLMDNIFLSGVNFTTHFLFQPRTNASRLFTWSLSFWGMLMGAAYTANLASFLVVDRSANGIQVTQLSEAVAKKHRLCVLRGGAVNDTIYRNFNTTKPNVVGYDTTEEQLQAVETGGCDLAITEVYSWEFWERQASVNGNCDLAWIGKAYKFVPAGFATISDSGTLCTSLITDVINFWMWNLKEEGFIDRAWQTHLDRLASISCEQEDGSGNLDSNDSNQLHMGNMGGIFIFHCMLSILALLNALVYKYVGWDKIPRFAKSGPGNRKNVRNVLAEAEKSGQPLTRQERRLLKASRTESVPELFQKVKHRRGTRMSSPPFTTAGAQEAPNQTEVSFDGPIEDDEFDPSPDIRDDDALSRFVTPRQSTLAARYSMPIKPMTHGGRVDMVGEARPDMAEELARLSSLQDEQVVAMREVREQMNSMMDMMKKKLK